MKWSFISSAFPSDWKNEEMNSEPLSEVTCEGTPCLEKMWRMNNLASIGAVIMSMVRMKIDCLESRSTITRMVLCLEDGGSFSMKPMEMEFQGCSGTGSCLRSPYGRCLCGFERIQVVHDLT